MLNGLILISSVEKIAQMFPFPFLSNLNLYRCWGCYKNLIRVTVFP